jgi:hypothetical protein
MQNLLTIKLNLLFREEGIDPTAMMPVQRTFLTRYRCTTCKVLPLYLLNLSHLNKPRCGKCGHLVTFKNAGKYGKMRKKLALMLWQANQNEFSPQNEHDFETNNKTGISLRAIII